MFYPTNNPPIHRGEKRSGKIDQKELNFHKYLQGAQIYVCGRSCRKHCRDDENRVMFAFNFPPPSLVSSNGAFFATCLSYLEGGCVAGPRPEGL